MRFSQMEWCHTAKALSPTHHPPIEVEAGIACSEVRDTRQAYGLPGREFEA
jgi:hypothetical protein